MALLSPSSSVAHSASSNLQQEWDECCNKVMGFRELTGRNGPESKESASSMVILNLVDNWMDDPAHEDDDIDNSETSSSDPWFDNACSINDSLSQMADMIRKNRRQYVAIPFFPNQELQMTDEEASILESTVLSFAATTANQIEALREQVPSTIGWDMSQHYAGIVACLLLRLREEIAEPMSSLQKQRSRVAFAIFQQPLACRIVSPSEYLQEKDYWDEALGDDGETSGREVRFLPKHLKEPATAADGAHAEFLSTYQRDADALSQPLRRPISLFEQDASTEVSVPPPMPPVKKAKAGIFGRKPVAKAEDSMPYAQQSSIDGNMLVPPDDQLRQESALLTIRLQSDLDSVQKVEERMTEITQLLSQFSTLVSEQQEDIQLIHDTAVSSKKNVSTGQDLLVDATERTKRSRHYMATVIWSAALILLFFNFVTP